MKKIILLFFLTMLVSCPIFQISFAAVNAEEQDKIEGRYKAAYLCDNHCKTEMYSYKSKEHLPIASMCKIMTLLLCFEAEESGEISFDQPVTVSQNAASMGGSQVFLEANGKYPVKDLIKSICIASANDSCVAMAELISGSELSFVSKMNQRAKELGMLDTSFTNCTGLPKAGQYSCAEDVAKMFGKLIEKESYFNFCKIRTDTIEHSGGRITMMTNTNKLLRNYSGCDSGKTGYTADAGFCLSASANRNGMRIISVIIGSDSSAERFSSTCKMFDYAFSNYKIIPIVKKESTLEQHCPVLCGKNEEITVVPQNDYNLICKNNSKPNLTTDIQINCVKAPIYKGDSVGTMTIFQDGVEITSISLCANEDSLKMNYWDRLRNICNS